MIHKILLKEPTKLYGMQSKGSIAVGYDADLVVWYPKGKMEEFVLKNEMLHHDIDYSPFEGMKFTNWPRWTVLRGKVVWDRDGDGITGSLGDGKYIRRGKSLLAGPRGALNPIFE
ncbi:Dihydropyrimidinase [Cyberlindnera fabianii]|uniref:dihydropyrimidinase n=1 Tax=Cyberlindnera fabianii TaxID=36022 RepID=A0A1V2KYF7_CYBFA|nr:Dihydropyrimidinase [Cyberlindnera fabianii]